MLKLVSIFACIALPLIVVNLRSSVQSNAAHQQQQLDCTSNAPSATDRFVSTQPLDMAATAPGAALSAQDWTQLFNDARAALSANEKRTEGVIYLWKGGPLVFPGQLVNREDSGFAGQPVGSGSDLVFQVDPVAYANILFGPGWQPDDSQLGSAPALLMDGVPVPPSCMAMVTGSASGCLLITCGGKCIYPNSCTGSSGPTIWCACSTSGPPTTEPTYCHSRVTPGPDCHSVTFSCTGTCATGTCNVACTEYQGFDYFWCACDGSCP